MSQTQSRPGRRLNLLPTVAARHLCFSNVVGKDKTAPASMTKSALPDQNTAGNEERLFFPNSAPYPTSRPNSKSTTLLVAEKGGSCSTTCCRLARGTPVQAGTREQKGRACRVLGPQENQYPNSRGSRQPRCTPISEADGRRPAWVPGVLSGVWESQLLEAGVLGVQPLLLGSWGPPVPGEVRFECRAAQWGEGSAPSQPAHDSIHIPETRDWSQITENPHFQAEKLWLCSACSWPGPCEAHREIHCQSTLTVNSLGFGVEEGGES